jgi:BirA family biotin operon repressor/biotin-[acetyl-CoA-carboxylase] ligase
VKGPRIGAEVRRLDVCPSTSDVARGLAETGAAHGTAVVAEEQTMGRGTKGRPWHSPRGKGLYVSFVLRPRETGLDPRSLPLLPLAAGLAGAEAVTSAAGVSASLKWPNDLVWGRLKFGGILSESVFRGGEPLYSVVGIGINVNHSKGDFPRELRPFATSIRLILGRETEKGPLFARLCRSLESWYNALRGNRTEEVVRAYQRKMAFSPGDRIIVTTHGGRAAGVFTGLGRDGRLGFEAAGKTTGIPFEDIRALDWD